MFRLPPIPDHATLRLTMRWPLGLLPVALAGQLLTPHPVWIALFCTVGLLYLFSWGWLRLQVAGIDLSRRREQMLLVAGDVVTEELTLINRSSLPILWAAFRDESELPGYRPNAVVAAPQGQQYRWKSTFTCAERGVFRLGPHSLEIGDIFSFCTLTFRFAHNDPVLIHPRIVRLPAVEWPRTGQGDNRAIDRRLTGPQPAPTVRDYMAGDSLRAVSWKATAHRGKLSVREAEVESGGVLWIVADLFAPAQKGEGRHGTLEVIVMLAAGAAAQLISERTRAGVGLLLAPAGPDGDESSQDATIEIQPQPGQGHLWSLLAALAPVRPGRMPLGELLLARQGRLGRHATLLLITTLPPAEETDWLAAVGRLRRAGFGITVLLVIMPDDQAAAGSVIDRLLRLDVPCRTVTTDVPLPLAVTHRRKRRVVRSTPTGGAFTVEVEEEVG
jgi:uncharacterized protein (DUF58 family)